MAHAFLRIVPPSQRGRRLQWVGVCHLNASVPSRVVPLHQRVVLPRAAKRTPVEFVGDTGAGCIWTVYMKSFEGHIGGNRRCLTLTMAR